MSQIRPLKFPQMDLERQASKIQIKSQGTKAQALVLDSLTPILAVVLKGCLFLGAAQLTFTVQDGDDVFVDQLKETSRTEGTGVLQPLLQKLEQLKSSLHENREKALETLPTKLLLPLFLSFAPSAMSLLACSLYLAAKDLQLEP